MMAVNQRTLLLDTNIWLDYFDSARIGFESAVALVRFALASDIELLVTPTSCKDFYYQCAYAIKQEVRQAGKEATPDVAASAEEFAWGCLNSMLDMATVVSMGDAEARMSHSLHRLHRDFEDDLVIAVAMRCKATYLVTGDRRLAASSPVPTLNAEQALAMLMS